MPETPTPPASAGRRRAASPDAAANGRRRSRKAGLPPGTLIHVGRRREAAARVMVMDYDEGSVREQEIARVEDAVPFRDAPTVTWISVSGLHDVSVVERLGTVFHLHPLVQEDILNTAERPKMEDYGDAIFFVLKIFHFGHGDHGEHLHQVSLVLGPNFVISFEEEAGPFFDPVRERIRRGKGRLRAAGADYLAYALIDCVVDSYFSIMERMDEEIDGLEETLIGNPGREVLRSIHDLKREMIEIRRSVWPLREVVNGLERLETPLIKPTTDIFLRDLYDHTVQIIDNIETYRDILGGMLETYLSSVSNRMNEVMKVLTVIATIFIPLTFLAGVYGMNFDFMPELHWKYGYFVVWGVMLAAGGLMLAYFKRKKWL